MSTSFFTTPNNKNNIKALLSITLMCFAMSFSTGANAQASDSSVIKLMEVTHMSNVMNQAINQNVLAIPAIAQQMVASKKQKLSDSQKAQLNKIVKDYMSKLNTELNSSQNRQALTNSYISVAKKHFSQAEVDAQIEFYGSSLGQSIIKKHSAMVNDYMTAIMPNILQKSETSIKSLLPQLEADINAVIQP